MKAWNEKEIKVGDIVLFIDGYKSSNFKYGKILKICRVKATLEVHTWGNNTAKKSVNPEKIFVLPKVTIH